MFLGLSLAKKVASMNINYELKRYIILDKIINNNLFITDYMVIGPKTPNI